MTEGQNKEFIKAAVAGDIVNMRQLILKGADLNHQDSWGYTALIGATRQGHVECVKDLIKAGADINQKGEWGNTALISAAEKGNHDC